MKQLGFGDNSFTKHPKITRKQQFLAVMDKVVPWGRLCAVIAPHYPTIGKGRPPFPLETMLRIHFMQQWFALSDPAMEEALHDMPVMREFAKLDASSDAMPDESTILRFRHLLEKHGLAHQLFAEISGLLAERGLMLRQGTIVDATLIAAPSSTKNADGKRDPEMSQTKKGNQWYFGAKAHIGVDAHSGLVHTVEVTTAKSSDIKSMSNLLHGDERLVIGDGGYHRNEYSVDANHEGARPRIVTPFKRKAGQQLTQWQKQVNHALAKLRAIVEHPFRVVKRQFGYTKVRYRGLAKNGAQMVTLFALSNLYQARRHLMPQQGYSA